MVFDRRENNEGVEKITLHSRVYINSSRVGGLLVVSKKNEFEEGAFFA
jgi:hypothetical protein